MSAALVAAAGSPPPPAVAEEVTDLCRYTVIVELNGEEKSQHVDIPCLPGAVPRTIYLPPNGPPLV